MDPMTEATTTRKSKSASTTYTEPTPFPAFGKFEMPKFELPNMEVPAAFRDFAEKGLAQAKGNYEKVKAAAEEATDLLEDTYATASKGMSDYGLKVIEAARANTNASFDFATELFGVKSISEVVELTTAHARKQSDAITAQGKELGKRLWDNVATLYDGLTEQGFKLGPEHGPVVGVHLPDRMTAIGFWRAMLDAGIYVNVAVPPATPNGVSLLRCSLCAAHTKEQLEHMIEVMTGIGRQMGVLAPKLRVVVSKG